MGLRFPNPVGLAAGLDKNAAFIESLADLGFGSIEVGTVTPRPQPGNPPPRLFRLPRAGALINRLGFNNQGLEALVARVRAARSSALLGVNLGKNADTPVERAGDDYAQGLAAVYPYARYVTINISSPNTRDPARAARRKRARCAAVASDRRALAFVGSARAACAARGEDRPRPGGRGSEADRRRTDRARTGRGDRHQHDGGARPGGRAAECTAGRRAVGAALVRALDPGRPHGWQRTCRERCRSSRWAGFSPALTRSRSCVPAPAWCSCTPGCVPRTLPDRRMPARDRRFIATRRRRRAPELALHPTRCAASSPAGPTTRRATAWTGSRRTWSGARRGAAGAGREPASDTGVHRRAAAAQGARVGRCGARHCRRAVRLAHRPHRPLRTRPRAVGRRSTRASTGTTGRARPEPVASAADPLRHQTVCRPRDTAFGTCRAARRRARSRPSTPSSRSCGRSDPQCCSCPRATLRAPTAIARSSGSSAQRRRRHCTAFMPIAGCCRRSTTSPASQSAGRRMVSHRGIKTHPLDTASHHASPHALGARRIDRTGA